MREEEIRTAYHAAKDNLNSMDCAKAIADAKEALQKVREVKSRLKEEKEELCGFQTKVSELIAWFAEEQYVVPEQKILSSLTEDTVTKVHKESCVAAFLKKSKSTETKSTAG